MVPRGHLNPPFRTAGCELFLYFLGNWGFLGLMIYYQSGFQAMALVLLEYNMHLAERKPLHKTMLANWDNTKVDLARIMNSAYTEEDTALGLKTCSGSYENGCPSV